MPNDRKKKTGFSRCFNGHPCPPRKPILSFRAGKELGMRSPIWQKGFSEVRITDAGDFSRFELISVII
jgi:hypothetical protein